MKSNVESFGVFLRQTTENGQVDQESDHQERDARVSPRPVRRQLKHQPRDSQHHDVLIVPPKGVVEASEFFRVPVTKDESSSEVGQYRDPPERMDAEDWGQRKVLSAAFPEQHGPLEYRGLKRGPAFSVLPIKPEPASTSCVACYLVAADNVNYPNPWTHGLWNSPTAQEDEQPLSSPTDLDVLLAAGQGKVLRLHVADLSDWEAGGETIAFRRADGTAVATLEAIDLGREAEVWGQLRNGCVAGRVLLAEEGRVVPLVNITSLQDLSAEGNGGH